MEEFNVTLSETEREWKELLQQAKVGMEMDSQVLRPHARHPNSAQHSCSYWLYLCSIYVE